LWRDHAKLLRTFMFRLCDGCERGFWQRRRRPGGPKLYCRDVCRRDARRSSKLQYMRKARTETGIPHHGFPVELVDGKLVRRRRPGGDQRPRMIFGIPGVRRIKRARRPTS
jgi:hypothetical protein